MRTVKVASVYPLPSRVERPLYQGDFKIPAVPQGAQPFILEIEDHYQFEPQPYFTGTVGGRQKMERKLVAADEIANDIIKVLTKDHPAATPECHPGIWIVRDTVQVTDAEGKAVLGADNRVAVREMTEAEKKAAWGEDFEANRRAQAAWGEAAIHHGNVMAQKPEKVPFIPNYCRVLAVYYGQSPAWLNRIADGNTKTCQWCSETIAATSTICPKCDRTVDFVRYAKLEADLKAEIEKAAKGVITPPVKPTTPAQPSHSAA